MLHFLGNFGYLIRAHPTSGWRGRGAGVYRSLILQKVGFKKSGSFTFLKMGPGSQKCGSREPRESPLTGDGKYFIVHPIVH